MWSLWNYYCRFSIISSQNGWIDLVWVLYNWRKWSVPKLRFWKMAHPCPLLHLFLVFSNGSFLQQNDQDMNTRRLDCQSLPRNHPTRAPSKSSYYALFSYLQVLPPLDVPLNMFLVSFENLWVDIEWREINFHGYIESQNEFFVKKQKRQFFSAPKVLFSFIRF